MMSAAQLERKIKQYHPDADTGVVERAYVFARKAHSGQTRASGEPYFSHVVATARNLVDMQVDPTTVAAGLLHDVPEDTAVTLDDVRTAFGEEIAFLVDGVTKMSKLRSGMDQSEAATENLRKMLLAMARDIRVVLIKFADRLHNMETLDVLRPDKRRRIAQETMEVYAPLAERLGMGEIKGRLQDLAFPYTDPEGYAWVKEASAPLYQDAERYLRRVLGTVESLLSDRAIPAAVHGRSKHVYSLYRKVQAKDRSFSDVYDLVAVRILVDDVPACYETLGLVHQQWKPLLGRIKDYISLPKPNGYQSLHTTVFCIDGRLVEFQIRTHQMHREAEYGIAAHWGYKEGAAAGSKKFDWVQQLASWQQDVAASDEFLEALKIDTFKHRIFVFTPKGDVKDLPAGATPLDFAYTIHTKVGDRCAGAKVNGKMTTLATPLANGDVVDIMTSPKASPKIGWLDMAVTSGARAHVRKYLKEQAMKEVADTPPVHGVADGKPATEVKPQPLTVRSAEAALSGHVYVAGSRDFLVRFAQCCKPVSGDSIIGIVTVGKGVSVHQRWCGNVRQIGDPSRLVKVSWEQEPYQRVLLRVEAFDRHGLTRDIASVISAREASIVGIRGEVQEDETVRYSLRLDVPPEADLGKILQDLRRHSAIYYADRE